MAQKSETDVPTDSEEDYMYDEEFEDLFQVRTSSYAASYSYKVM